MSASSLGPVAGLLAVDSGGSGTRVRHSSLDRVVELPPVSWAAGDVPAQLAALVASGWTTLGGPPTDTVAVGVAATPGTDAEVARLAAPLAAAVGAGEVIVANDAVTGHLAALGGGWGVSLVVGTGVACAGTSAAPGRGLVVVDGFGPLIGDLGSAYWIGRTALRAVLDDDLDGLPPTELTRIVLERCGPLATLPSRVHASTTAVTDIAGLAPVVAFLADQEPRAREVLEQAARHLTTTAERAVRRVAAASPGVDPVPVALGGMALQPGSWLAGRVGHLVAGGPHPVAVRPAAGLPLDGVAMLASWGETERAAAAVRSWTPAGVR
jgi:N-acetylglucosamine kinase-like BadF-type ATPase